MTDKRPSVRMWRCPSHGVTGTLSGDSLFLHEQATHNSRMLCVSLYDEPVVAQSDPQRTCEVVGTFENGTGICGDLLPCPMHQNDQERSDGKSS